MSGERLHSVEEARAAVLAAVDAPLGEEVVAVDAALGRVLSREVIAAVTLPPWDNSAMDGYAIRAADVTGAAEDAPIRLEVVGEVPAGGVAERAVRHGSAIRIATGAPIPDGADAVVPVELTTPLDAGEQIAVLIPVLALLLSAFAAACGPALRATRIAPSIAVRAD